LIYLKYNLVHLVKTGSRSRISKNFRNSQKWPWSWSYCSRCQGASEKRQSI